MKKLTIFWSFYFIKKGYFKKHQERKDIISEQKTLLKFGYVWCYKRVIMWYSFFSYVMADLKTIKNYHHIW